MPAEFLLYSVFFTTLGFVLGLLGQWRLARRAYRLELRQADLEEQLLKQRNKAAIKERWAKSDPEADLLKLMQTAPRGGTRFANDPMGE